jgi:ubiquinone/menaquinone biosynthesis C-methylase UbiE
MELEKIQEKIGHTLGQVASVLDVGCGSGALVEFLAEHVAQEALGIDIQSDGFHKEVASSKDGTSHSAGCVKGDARSMDAFPNERFDAVVTAHAFHELSDPETALSEIRRVLKPGGTLFIADFAKGETRWDERYYTPEEVEAMLEKGGFTQIEVEKVSGAHFLFAFGKKISV